SLLTCRVDVGRLDGVDELEVRVVTETVTTGGRRRTLRTGRRTVGPTRTTGTAVARRALRRDAAGTDLRPVGHEPAQQVHVLVVDVLDALLDEDARLLLGAASVVLVLRA